MKVRTLIFVASLVVMNSCLLQRRIAKGEAIRRAEDFVIEQGYAHKKINLDSTATKIDVTEYFLDDPSQISEWRYNSLVPKAVHIKEKFDGWLVAFRSTNEIGVSYYSDSIKVETRVVRMSKNGKQIRIEHQGYFVYWNEMIEN